MINDLIRRQDAIDALGEQLDYLRMLNKNENPTAEGKWYGINWARNTIADLPSAEKAFQALEKSPGEWIKDNSGKRFCSECGRYALYHEIGTQMESRFCPNCGVKMQKGGAT